MGAATVPQAQGKPASQGPWLGVLSPRCRLCAHHLAVCARRPPAPPLTGVVAGDGSLSDCRLPGSPDPVVSQSKLTVRHGARAPTPTCRTRTRQFLRLRPAVCTLCRSHPPSVQRQPGLKREHRTSSFQRGYPPSNESGQVLDATSLPMVSFHLALTPGWTRSVVVFNSTTAPLLVEAKPCSEPRPSAVFRKRR